MSIETTTTKALLGTVIEPITTEYSTVIAMPSHYNLITEICMVIEIEVLHVSVVTDIPLVPSSCFAEVCHL